MNTLDTMLNRAIAVLTIALTLLIGWALSAAPGPSARWLPVERPVGARSFPVQLQTVGARLASVAARRVHHNNNRVDRRAAAPRRIQIPAIGISAPVIPLGLNPDGTIQTPTAWGQTGWYKPGPEPGERGPAVIVGHVDSTTGPAVFFRLRELRPGDPIRIRRSDGSAVRFRVRRVERWPKSEFPTNRVYGPSRGAVLRLVTCSGNFNASTGHYADNTIVYASRV